MKKVNNKITIAFDVSTILAAKGAFGDKSGVYRYHYQLLKNLIIHHNNHVDLVLFTVNPELNNRFLFILGDLIDNVNVKYVTTNYKDQIKIKVQENIFNKIINRIKKFYFIKKYNEKNIYNDYYKKLDILFKENSVDLVHHGEHSFIKFKDFINVVTINDLIPFIFPFWQTEENLSIHKRKLSLAAQCEGVIFISNHTKNDYMRLTKSIKNQESLVTHLGGNIETFSVDFATLNNLIEVKGYKKIKKKKYFLYVGTFEPRKNILSALKAFIECKDHGLIPEDTKFVLVGGKGWGEIHDLVKTTVKDRIYIINKDDLILLDFVSDNYLTSLIKNASATVFPSFYEGFGLPIVESLELGTCVLSSNTSSLPEAGGDACIYFDPYNFESIKSAFIKTQDKVLLNSLKLKASKQINKFSWEKVAKKTVGFYEKLIEINKN